VYRYLTLALAAALLLPALAAADDTPKAAKTRAKLSMPVSVEWKDTLFRAVVDELNDDVPALGIRADTKNGVNLNQKITYKAKEKPVGEVLNELCDKFEMGWYIISNKANGYDGTVYFTRGKERGYEAGKEPDKTAATKEKPDKTKTANKEPEKPKPEAEKPKAEPKETPEKTAPKAEDDADENERVAGRRLQLAKELQDDGKPEKARDVLQEIVKKYPKTTAAEEAQKLL
jgi:hypothetical protein